MRAWVLTDLASQMQVDYEKSSAEAGQRHDSGEAVHQYVKNRDMFKWYSSLRCATQELVWQSVLSAIASDPESIEQISAQSEATHGGSLVLDAAIALPDYTDSMDVHLMPGNYQGSEDSGAEAGAVYDNGLEVFSFGVMGEESGRYWTLDGQLHAPEVATTPATVDCRCGVYDRPQHAALETDLPRC